MIRKVVPGVAIKRARFSAVTQTDVWNAFRNLVEPNKYESDAVNYRQEVDLRLGVAFTIFQSLTLQNSVGVSGVTLSLSRPSATAPASSPPSGSLSIGT